MNNVTKTSRSSGMGDSDNTYRAGTISVWKAISAVQTVLLLVLSSILGWVCSSVIDNTLAIKSMQAELKVVDRVRDQLYEHTKDGHPYTVIEKLEGLRRNRNQ